MHSLLLSLIMHPGKTCEGERFQRKKKDIPLPYLSGLNHSPA